MDITAEQIEALVRPHLDREQVKLCGVRVSGRASRPLIQLFIDWEETSITIDACASISRQMLDLFDMQERFARDYRLEVSSPGIGWPLSEAWQFRKNIGREIVVHREDGELEAKLLDVTANGVVRLEVGEEIVERSVGELRGAKVVLSSKKGIKPRRKRNEARNR